jgi:hypothetical protein
MEIGQDRTVKQPVTAFCRNPECANETGNFEFQVEHSGFACPKCGADREPYIGVQTLTHCLVQDKNGPIIGSGGRHYRIACDSKRAYLATVSNQEAATDQPQIVNCPGCRQQVHKMGIVDPTGVPLTQQMEN